jgi:hypothetical protein
MKAGIVCVYYVPGHTSWILELHLQRIRQHSQNMDYHIYGADVRLAKPEREQLENEPNCTLYPADSTSSLPNREHGENLTYLTQLAFEDGCDFVVTLDVDSFPIADDWLTKLAKYLRQSDGVTAVFRAENNDICLTHPCGTAISSAFYEKYNFDFYPDKASLKSEDFNYFLNKSAQRVDTGIGLAKVLWENKLSWHRLLRTNEIDIHPLMGGIYDDMIFHLGATSRTPEFDIDWQRQFLGSFIKRRQQSRFLWKLHRLVRRKLINRNRHVQEEIERELKRNSEQFFFHLRTPER